MPCIRVVSMELELEVYGALQRPGSADELEGALETQLKAWHLSRGSTTLPNV